MHGFPFIFQQGGGIRSGWGGIRHEDIYSDIKDNVNINKNIP